jgi:hypothetical protein
VGPRHCLGALHDYRVVFLVRRCPPVGGAAVRGWHGRALAHVLVVGAEEQYDAAGQLISPVRCWAEQRFPLSGRVTEGDFILLRDCVQQWNAVQMAGAAGLRFHEVWSVYRGVGGDLDEFDVHGYLGGLIMVPQLQRDLLAHAINELLDAAGIVADGAHYSSDDIALKSGFGEYLRPLILTPDAYDFDRPSPAGSMVRASPPGERDGLEDELELRRCHALYESGLLVMGREGRFDRITARVREHFDVSSSSIVVITEDSQVIKSVTGPIGQDLPRNLAFCSHTIEQNRTLVIPDASTNPDYQDHPLVTGGPRIRFYAGRPLTTADGWRIGSLCFTDDRPRAFSRHDERDLLAFVREAEREIQIGS